MLSEYGKASVYRASSLRLFVGRSPVSEGNGKVSRNGGGSPFEISVWRRAQ